MKMSVCNQHGSRCSCSSVRVAKSLTQGWGPYLVQIEGRDYEGKYWSTMSEHKTIERAEKAAKRITP